MLLHDNMISICRIAVTITATHARGATRCNCFEREVFTKFECFSEILPSLV